jgi:hypothetical protein
MTKNVKRVTICLVTALILTVIILLIPGFMKKSLPTVSPVKIAKIDYTDTVLSDGEIFIDEGNGNFIVKTFIPEKDISRVKFGLRANVTGDAFPNETYEAEVIGIADGATKTFVGNATKTTVEVWLQILKPGQSLKNGYTTAVEIIAGETEKKRLIPYEAVSQDEQGTYIFVLKGNTAVKRYIKTGEDLPDGIEVISGLDENEDVIDPPEGVGDGDEVKLEGGETAPGQNSGKAGADE